MCFGVCFLGSNFFGTLWAYRISYKPTSFASLGKFSFIICSNTFSISWSSSSPSGSPMIQMLEHLKLSQRFLSLSSFFLNSYFFILFWLNFYFFFLLQIVDLSPCFLPFTVGSLYIFFISLCIVFTSLFCSHTQLLLWAFWLPVFWTLHLIGLLSSHHVVLYREFWYVLSFGPHFLVSVHLLCLRIRALGIH